MTLKQQKPNLVLFLGSGFTRGLWKKAPTMDNLFASVLRELRNFKDRCLMQLLSEIMAEHFPQISKSDWSEINFEVFLTRIDDLKKKAKRTSTAQKGQDIEEFWRWLVAATGRAVHKSIPYGDYEDKRKQRKMAALIELLTAAKAKSKSVSIITTNYDLFLDKAVGRIIDKGLHGAHVTYDIAFRHLKRHQYGVPLLGIWSQNEKGKPIRIDNGEDWKRLPQEIQIYKLHGSVNWAYCECCQGIYGNFSFADLKRIFSPEKVTCPSVSLRISRG